jgi:hypothetical protein
MREIIESSAKFAAIIAIILLDLAFVIMAVRVFIMLIRWVF